MSYHGGAFIINSLGHNKFWYLAPFRYLSADTIKKTNTLATFIWQKKRTFHGGLGVLDVPRRTASLHVLWVKWRNDNQTSPWAASFKNFPHSHIFGKTHSTHFASSFSTNLRHESIAPILSFSDAIRNVVLDSKSSQIAVASLSSKVVFAILLQKQRTKNRCEATYQSWGYSKTCSNVWPNLNLWRFPRQVRDTF